MSVDHEEGSVPAGPIDPVAARALEALVDEAREHLVPPAAEGGAELESRLLAAVEADRTAAAAAMERQRRTGRALRAGAFVLAAAAAVALFVRRDREPELADRRAPAPPVAIEGALAGSLRATEGNGHVRIGAVVATSGHLVRDGDTIEVDGARGVFERPGKVSWLMEQDGAHGRGAARAHVKSAAESIVLALEHGVIEAQVVPVSSGEAFAVDIATEHGLVRVAVHGTHLRVARAGTRVVVDLTEGVVAIGIPPQTGITVGTTVTAPAHVELDATDLSTLRIDSTLAAVRAPVPLGTSATPTPQGAPPTVVAGQGPVTVAAHPREASHAPSKVEAHHAALPAREAIAAGVRSCAKSHARSGEVHVSVTSTLRLEVAAGGTVESAQFSPPLSPDVQTCAAQVIYKTKLEETGTVTIPIAFSY